MNVQAIAGSMKSETFRFPIGDGTDVPTISKAFGSGNGLLGEEYATPVGKNVFPFMWGSVFDVISGDASLGDAVIIQHTLVDGMAIYSLYAHLSKVLRRDRAGSHDGHKDRPDRTDRRFDFTEFATRDFRRRSFDRGDAVSRIGVQQRAGERDGCEWRRAL